MEIVLSDKQKDEFQVQIYQAMVEAIDRARNDKNFKMWMKKKDLVNYLPVSDKFITDHLSSIPYHQFEKTKFYNRIEVDKFLLSK